MSKFGRRQVLKGATATAALLGAARAALPSGAFAQGAGVETNKVTLGFIALALVMVVASLLLTNSVVYFKEKSLFDILTNYIVFSASLFYVAAVAAVFVLRKTHPEWPRPYRTLFYPWVPLAYVTFYAWFLWMIFMGNPGEALIGIGLIALGLPVYAVWSRGK